MSWHTFIATTDDDSECTICQVVVSEDAMRLYSTPCPAPPCGDDSNTGGCVIVPSSKGPICAYCERLQRPGDDEDDDVLPDDAEADALLAGADAELYELLLAELD